ncbi:MAG: acyltransferase family protein [Cetobacterium sp.]
MKKDLSKDDVQLMKGVGILLMVSLHLFGFPSWLKDGVVYKKIIENINLEYTLAKFGGICVGLYVFLSGYGMEKKSKNGIKFKECFIKVIDLYKIYWTILIPFTFIGVIWFDLKIDLKELALNLFGINPSYNVFVWFIRLYIQLLLLFPIIKKILDWNYKKAITITLSIYLFTIFNAGFFYIFQNLKPFRETFFYELLYSFCFWQFIFCNGYLFSKYNLFQKIYEWIDMKKIPNVYLISLVTVVVVRILMSKLVGKIILFDIFMLDFVFVPILIVCCVGILKNSIFKILFLKLGKHSTNIWLMHSYFTLTYFQKFTYSIEYSLLVLIFTFILTIGISKSIFFIKTIKI